MADAKPKKKHTGAAVGAVVAVVIVVAAAFVVMNGGLNLDFGTIAPEKPKETVYKVEYGDIMQTPAVDAGKSTFDTHMGYEITTNVFDATVGAESCFKFTLKNIDAKYTHFKWVIFDNDHRKYDAYSSGILIKAHSSKYGYTINDTEYSGDIQAGNGSSIFWKGENGVVGSFKVTAYCYESEADYTASKTLTSGGSGNYAAYESSILCQGTVMKKYAWSYYKNLDTSKSSTLKFELSLPFKYSDYDGYKNNSTYSRKPLSASDYDKFTKYVTSGDSNLITLSNRITDVYKKAFGPDASTTGQAYADFVLAFVQINYDYPPNNGTSFPGDKTIYGEKEYYAYPMETIMRGVGDCEDTSILTATLLKIAGYSTALGLLPGHAIVGVVIDGFAADTVAFNKYTPESNKFTTSYAELNAPSMNFIAGETTVDNQLPFGFLMTKDMTGFEEHNKFYPVGS